MQNYSRGLLVAFMAFVGLVGSWPARAMAYDCTSLVVDDAGVLGSDIASVQESAQKLEKVGAYVRIRTVNDFGGFADLDRYEADYEAHCQAWQDMSGGTKSNLLVFAVSYASQRGVGLYYGDLWKKALDAQWNGVLTDDVVPHLRDGDNGAALSAGLNGIGEIIAASKAARTATTSGTAPVVIVQQPSVPSQPVDLTGLWSVMGWVLAIGVVFGALYGIVLWRRKVAETREAQQKARLSMQACVNYVTSAEEPLVLAEATVNGQARNFAAADIEPMRATLVDARRKLAAAQTVYGELQAADANPDKPGLTAGEYGNIQERYDDLLVTFRAATASVNGIDAQITQLVTLAASANEASAATAATVDYGARVIDVAEGERFRVETANATLALAVQSLDRGEAAKEAKSFVLMGREFAQAHALAHQAVDEVGTVRKEKAEIDAEIAARRNGAVVTDTLLEQAGATFRDIAASYAPSSWDNVNGNGSAAEQLLRDAGGALDAAEAAGSMESQDWTTAHAQLASATGGIQRARDLANAIIALKQDLDAAKEAAPREVELARQDIVSARAFIAQHDDDIDDGLETRLDKAQRALDETGAELRNAQPNYLTAVKAARAVNGIADKILEKAQDEHRAMERKRERAVTSLREAERSVSAADNYVRSHRSDVDSDAERLAADAGRTLETARNAQTLDGRIQYADQADQEADRSLDMAKRDVRSREEEREHQARRQREAAEAIVRTAAEAAAARSRASSMHHSSSSSSSFGHRSGGSIGFGGSGGRSGGSVSSGGRGGRGGGSVGW